MSSKKPSFFAVASAVKLVMSSKARKQATYRGDESAEFRHWAADFDLHNSTLQALTSEYYNSFSTVRTLTPEIIATLGINDDQSEKLEEAVKHLWQDKNESLSENADQALNSARSKDEKNSIFRKIVATFREVELIDKQTQEFILNETSFRKQLEAFKTVISRLEQIDDLPDKSSVATFVDEGSTQIETDRSHLPKPLEKHSRWKNALREIKVNGTGISQNSSVNSHVTSRNTNAKTSFCIAADDHIINSDTNSVSTASDTTRLPSISTIATVMGASQTFKSLLKQSKQEKIRRESLGRDNPYFCFDDENESITALSLVARFGQKGKECGQLADVTSLCLSNAVVDCVLLACDTQNNRLQGFRANGSPGDMLQLDGHYEPWEAISVESSGSKLICVSYKRPGCVVIISGDNVLHSTITQICPHGLAAIGEHVLVTDICENDVYRYDISATDENKKMVWSLCTLNPTVQFNQPKYVTVSDFGKIVVSDTGNHCIKVFLVNGEFSHQFGCYGKGYAQFKFPHGVCCDRFGHVIVADHYNNRVSLFGTEGEFIRHLATEKHGVIRPRSVTLSRDGRLYVAHGMLKATEIIVFDLSLYSSGI